MRHHWAVVLSLVLIFSGCASDPSEPTPEPKNRRMGNGFANLAYNHKPVDASKDYELLVFFAYQCPHCYTFHKQEMQTWLDANWSNVNIKLVPVLVKASSAEPSARAFYAAEVLGRNPEFHGKLFAAFHDYFIELESKRDFVDFAERCCSIDRARFEAAYDSPEVENRLVQDSRLMVEYSIEETPAVVVNGKYYISLKTMPADALFGQYIAEILQTDEKKATAK